MDGFMDGNPVQKERTTTLLLKTYRSGKLRISKLIEFGQELIAGEVGSAFN